MPNPKLEILLDDADLVAINKPADMASVPCDSDVLIAQKLIAAQLGLPFRGELDPRIRPIHRIDKDTSGVLLFAKTRAAQQFVSEQFQSQQVAKTYLALVNGSPHDREGSIDAAIARDDANPLKMRINPRGKAAQTHWKLLQRFRDYALLEVHPRTGRTHQIRVHLAYAGMPLAIDTLYGRKPAAARSLTDPDAPAGLYLSSFKRDYRQKEWENERPLIARLTLHARDLSLKHPNGSAVNLRAEPPKDLRAVISALTKYAS